MSARWERRRRAIVTQAESQARARSRRELHGPLTWEDASGRDDGDEIQHADTEQLREATCRPARDDESQKVWGESRERALSHWGY